MSFSVLISVGCRSAAATPTFVWVPLQHGEFEVIELNRESLLSLVQTDDELNEIVM